jgi:hypothetical protein
VKVSEDKQLAPIGPGQLCDSVDKALEVSGVTVVEGRIPKVGVGGLILSGEYSRKLSDVQGLK